MKVRHKQTGVEKEVVASLGAGYCNNVHLFTDGTWQHASLCEEVKEETWRDVTGECELNRLNEIMHDQSNIKFHTQTSYRLRKVSAVVSGDATGNKPMLVVADCGPPYAFIVERKS